MDNNEQCTIHYIAAYYTNNQTLIEAGDCATYKTHFIYILENNIDINVNLHRIITHSNNQNLRYDIETKDGVFYCVIFSGLLRIAGNCRQNLMDHHDTIINAIDAKTSHMLYNEFTRILNYHNTPSNDSLYQVKQKITSVQNVIRENVEIAIQRGEQIDNINSKSALLETKVDLFNSTTAKVKHKICMDNVRVTLMLVLTIVCFIVALALLGYGIYEFITN